MERSHWRLWAPQGKGSRRTRRPRPEFSDHPRGISRTERVTRALPISLILNSRRR